MVRRVRSDGWGERWCPRGLIAAALAFAVTISISGCYWTPLHYAAGKLAHALRPYTHGSEIIVPETPPQVEARQEEPLALVVGLTTRPLGETLFPVDSNLAGPIQEANLFKVLRYPPRPEESLDLALLASVEIDFDYDWWSVLYKGVIASLTLGLTTPLLFSAEDHYFASGTLEVIRQGETVKIYTAEADVIVRYKIFDDDVERGEKAARAAATSVGAQLAIQLAQDRGLYRTLPS